MIFAKISQFFSQVFLLNLVIYEYICGLVILLTSMKLEKKEKNQVILSNISGNYRKFDRRNVTKTAHASPSGWNLKQILRMSNLFPLPLSNSLFRIHNTRRHSTESAKSYFRQGFFVANAYYIKNSFFAYSSTNMPNIVNEIKLDFKDVMLRPKRSTLKSRSDVSIDLVRNSQNRDLFFFS